MNEIHEVPAEDTIGQHLMNGSDCICQPEVIHRWQNMMLVGSVVRHRHYTDAQAASTHLARGY